MSLNYRISGAKLKDYHQQYTFFEDIFQLQYKQIQNFPRILWEFHGHSYSLTLSCWRSLSYRNQPTDLQRKSMNWFLYDRGLHQKRVNIQLNSCNSNCYNSKDHLNRTNSLVLSEFTSKPLQENSFHSNSHYSKNHLIRTNVWVPWSYFSSCNSNFGLGV